MTPPLPRPAVTERLTAMSYEAHLRLQASMLRLMADAGARDGRPIVLTVQDVRETAAMLEYGANAAEGRAG